MIRGSIDFVDHDKVRGWVQDERKPDAAISVVVSDATGVLGTVIADKFRADLKDAGISQGHHAYEFSFPSRLATSERHTLRLRTQDGTELPGSPIILEILHPTALAVGNIDHADRRRVEGWAQNDDRSREPVHLVVSDNGELICRILANRYRADLEAAGIGQGRHGFAVEFDEPLSFFKKHIIRLRREPDGLDLPGSPIVIEAAEQLDTASEDEIRSVLDRYNSDQDVERKIVFLAAELQRLAQQRADLKSQKFDRQRDRDLARRWGGSLASETFERQSNCGRSLSTIVCRYSIAMPARMRLSVT